MADVDEIRAALLAADAEQLLQKVQAGLANGLKANEILKSGLIASMNIVGERMASGEMFIPEVLMCARAMSQAVAVLKPALAAGETGSEGKILVGTVKGDLHDIGKNLVCMMLEGAGFEVINLGVDITPEAFVDHVRQHRPQVLGLSALLTTTMPQMLQTIRSLEEAGLRSEVRVVIGGAQVNRGFAEKIGADGYAPDAGGAVKLVKGLVAPRLSVA